MRKSQRNLLAQCCIVLCGFLLAVGPRLNAQVPGVHPGYLHGIRDLREAKGLLTHGFDSPQHAQAAATAIREIEAAIGELKLASNADEKNLQDVPPPENLPPAGRFRKVQMLLNQARQDIHGVETDPAAVSHKNHAIAHINDALTAVGSVL